MTDLQQIEFDQLTAALWNGTLSQTDFRTRALEVGASLTVITAELEALREEDGICQ